MTSTADLSGRRNAPPSVDLAGHFRDLARVAIPAILIGVLVGIGVFALRSALVTKQYSATVVAEVSPAGGEIVPGDAFVEQLRAPFIALSTDENVLNQVLTQVDTGWDTAELKANTEITPGTAPSLLSFTVTAPSSEEAEQVARATVTSIADAANSNYARDIRRRLDELQAQVTAEQARNSALPDNSDAKVESNATLADLNAQLVKLQNSGADSLSILAAPAAGSAPVAPKPSQEGGVAGVAAAIIAAELLVFARGRTGRRPNPIWARRIARKYGARLSYGKRGETTTVPPSLLPAFGQRHRRGRVALILTGEGVRSDHLPAGAGESTASGGTTALLIEHLDLTAPWWQRVDPGELVVAVVIIAAAGNDRADAERALSQLDEVGVARHLVVHRGSDEHAVATHSGDVRTDTGPYREPASPPTGQHQFSTPRQEGPPHPTVDNRDVNTHAQ